MTHRWWRLLTLIAVLASVGGCPQSGDGASAEADDDDDSSKKRKKKSADDDDDDRKAKKKKSESKSSDDDDDDEAGAERAVTAPEQQSYPLDAVKTIADDCQSPTVILATAPESVGADYAWAFASQAMLANQQFKVARNAPSAPGQVAFDVHQAGAGYQNAFVLVAQCQDGGTCNRLAAMYKAVVKSSSPQLSCGKLPMDLGPATKKRSFVDIGGSGEASLPKKTDIIGLCARLGACMIATDPGLSGNPSLDCQKRPAEFKTGCARNYPCAEVMACLDR